VRYPTLHLEALWTDLRYTVRTLARSPLFTATAVVTLAVGIGANAAIFSVVDALLLRSLPYPEPERLALVTTHYRSPAGEGERWAQDGRAWEAIRDHAELVDAAPFSNWVTGVNLFAGGEALHVDQQRVGAGFFRVLGVQPALGRGFLEAEDRPGGPDVVILSDGLWRRMFEGDLAILGRSILLRGEPHTVVGVMPAGFRGTEKADLWTPLRPSTSGEGAGTNYGIVARRGPGVSPEQADAEIAALGAALWEEQGNGGGEVEIRFALGSLQRGLAGGLQLPLFALWGAVGLVLVVVCANLASLMLARSSRRTREIAARMALGSGRGGVVRQILIESLVLASVGGAFGVLLGALGIDLVAGMAGDVLGVWQPVTLDARVMGVTALLALATSVAFGLAPALHASRLDLRAALVEGGSGGALSSRGGATRWPRRLLLVGEVAVGALLVIFAGLLARTFVNLSALDPGFEPEGVVSATLSLQDARYETRDEIERLFGESLEHIRRIPGVEAASVGLGLPFERPLNLGYRVIGGTGEETEVVAVSARYVTSGYFDTLRVPLLLGRPLGETDGPEAPPVAVVNRAFVERALEPAGLGGSPVGARVAIGGEELEIVGVVGSVLQSPRGLGGEAPLEGIPMVYLPAGQIDDEVFTLVHTWFQPSWVVRSALPEEATIAGIRSAMHDVDPRLPFAAFRSMAKVEADALGFQRVLMQMILTLAVIATLLTALGIYGLVANAVAERTRELGIRLALGATRDQVIRAVTLPGVGLAVVGAALGGGAALASARLLGHFLWGVSATDPWTLLGGAAALVVVAFGASLLPAMRVLDLDPARTLREE